MGDLTGISLKDPQNFLSAAARRRIGTAMSEALLLRERVENDVQTRFESQEKIEDLLEYMGRGKAAIDIANSRLRSAQIVLTAEMKEYRAVGIYGPQLSAIAEDLIEGAC